MIPSDMPIFLALEPIDLRWSLDILAGLVRDRLGGDPKGGALFLFFGRRRDRVKVLFYDHTGYCLLYKYLDRETYTFAVERDREGYTLSATGRFHHGGPTTYTARRGFRDDPPVWHYNQAPGELGPPPLRASVHLGGRSFDAWPADVGYPDHFFFGDPHINYHEGTAEFDDVKLYLPAGGGEGT